MNGRHYRTSPHNWQQPHWRVSVLRVVRRETTFVTTIARALLGTQNMDSEQQSARTVTRYVEKPTRTALSRTMSAKVGKVRGLTVVSPRQKR